MNIQTVGVFFKRNRVVIALLIATFFFPHSGISQSLIKSGAQSDEDRRKIRVAQNFLEKFVDKIRRRDTVGIASMHHPKGIFRSWEESGDYDESIESEDLSREEARIKDIGKFPGIQFSIMGDIPKDNFYHRALFTEISTKKVLNRCKQSNAGIFVNALFFIRNKLPLIVDSIYVTEANELPVWAVKIKTAQIKKCQIRLPYINLEFYKKKLYFEYIHLAFVEDESALGIFDRSSFHPEKLTSATQ